MDAVLDVATESNANAMNVSNSYHFALTVPEDVTTETLLYEINTNLTQLNAFVGFFVTFSFACLIVYIMIRPIFYFLR